MGMRGVTIVAPGYYDLLSGTVRHGTNAGWLAAASFTGGQLMLASGANPASLGTKVLWDAWYDVFKRNIATRFAAIEGEDFVFKAFSGKTGALVSAVSRLLRYGYNSAVSGLSDVLKVEFDETVKGALIALDAPKGSSPEGYGIYDKSGMVFEDFPDVAVPDVVAPRSTEYKELKSSFVEGKYFGDTIGSAVWQTPAGYSYSLYPKEGYRVSKFKTSRGKRLYYRPVDGWRVETREAGAPSKPLEAVGSVLRDKLEFGEMEDVSL